MWHQVLNAAGAGQLAPLPTAQAALEAARGGTDDQAQAVVDRLALVDLSALGEAPAHRAFWLNVYNALLVHGRRRLRPTGSVLTNVLLFERPVWWVGGHRLSLNDIEHGVLRGNRRAFPFFWRRPFSADDARVRLMATQLDPRIHFALNCGAVSCPPIRFYRAEGLDAQLELATRSFLGQATRVDRSRREVTLSALLRLYAGDFGSRTDAVRFTARHLDGDDALWLQEQADVVKVRFGAYDWTLTPDARSPSAERA